jgi:hypothetical protein
MLSRLLDIAESIDATQLANVQEAQDALATQALVFDVLFSHWKHGK